MTHGITPDEELVYHGRWLDVFRAGNGWEYAQRPGASSGVAIIAITVDNRLLLVEQYRVPLKKRVIELPGGMIDAPSTAEETVRSELLQETGYLCTEVIQVCEGALSPGLVNETNGIYRAKTLRRDGRIHEISKPNERGVVKWSMRGNLAERERIQPWEVPVELVPEWLEERRKEGLSVDLRVYAGLFFARRSGEGTQLSQTEHGNSRDQ